MPGLLGGVVLLALGCTESGAPSPPTPRFYGSSASEAVTATPARRLRRLSSREYDNVVRDLLGDASAPAERFVVDVYQNGYDNGSAALAVQSDQVVDYQSAAEALAARAVSSRLPQVLGGCDVATQGEAACLNGLLSTFAPRAFRRPLTDSERQRLQGVFQQEEAAGSDFGRAVQTVVEVILQSPQFLYREELGPAGATGPSGAQVALTAYEAASELSFLLTGSMPDDPLWAAVQAGRFETRDDYDRQAVRLLTTDGARQTLRAFLHQWMTTGRLATLAKDARFYPAFDQAMAASMSAELDRFYDDVMWSGTGSLRELFTSSRSYVDATLANLYALAPVVSLQPVAPGRLGRAASGALVPVDLDPTVRPGILTRAGFLAVHSDADSSGPVARGVFVLQALLCSPPPPPPARVPPAPAASDPAVQALTTRERFAKHVSDPLCAGCHTQIDGIGFGFEEFDGVGAFRRLENGQPVDSSGSIEGIPEIGGGFQGAAELTARLASSRVLAGCFARQAYRYAMGAVETSSADVAAASAASTPDANVTAVLRSIVDDPIFVNRTFE
ncbi:MAG TPA: DUF1592 domain-containing protein [Polyangiaceae bacterium]|nr:DUF1592 domain-containing protein [Polyangiaceae bacterium]